MIHPLIRLAAGHPELLAEHGQAYVALVGKEVSQWKAALVRRAIAAVVAAVAALLALVFVGVAVMLWGASPDDADMRSVLALVAPTVVALVVAGIAAFIAMKGGETSSAITDVKAQIHADLAMLREVSAREAVKGAAK